MTAALAGPAGYVSVLAVLGLLITREFVREWRAVTVRRSSSVGSLLTYCAGLAAFVILALRFVSFT